MPPSSASSTRSTSPRRRRNANRSRHRGRGRHAEGREPDGHHAAHRAAGHAQSPTGGAAARRRGCGGRRRRRVRVLRAREGSKLSVLSRRTAGRRGYRRHHRSLGPWVIETADSDFRMQIGKVVGTVVSTLKHRKFEGAKLLLVQPLNIDDTPRGAALLAVDGVGAGVNEKVLVVLEGRAAGEALGKKAAPVDAAIIGIIDTVTIH